MDQRQDGRFDPANPGLMPTPAGPFPSHNTQFPSLNSQWQQLPGPYGGMPPTGVPQHGEPLIDGQLSSTGRAPGGAQSPFNRMDFFPPIKSEQLSTSNPTPFMVGHPEMHPGPIGVIKLITLMFNSVAWQNRPARIYISGELVDPDNICLADLATFPRYLVLSAQDQAKEKTASPSRRKNITTSDGREITIFNYNDSSRADDFFFELQVWRRGDSNGAAPPRLLLDSSGPTLPSSKSSNLVWFEKMGFNKRELYITINCEKGLRVQDLFVVGVLKLGGQLYASLETSFPAPSSRRKNANGSSLVETIRTPLSTSPNPTSRSQGSVSSSTTWSSNSSDRSRSAMSIDSVPPSKRRKTGEDADVATNDEWSKIVAQVSAIDSNAVAQIDNLIHLNADLEGLDVDRIKAEWNEWFDSVATVIPDRKAVYTHIFVPAVGVSCFFGTLSATISAQMLRHHGQVVPLEDVFVLRLSRSKRPYFGLDARFLDVQTGQQVIYNSNIFFEFDHESRAVNFWLDTERDARPSYSRSLAQVIEYVMRKTSWLPLHIDQARNLMNLTNSASE